jgi:hypothetical protein
MLPTLPSLLLPLLPLLLLLLLLLLRCVPGSESACAPLMRGPMVLKSQFWEMALCDSAEIMAWLYQKSRAPDAHYTMSTQ